MASTTTTVYRIEWVTPEGSRTWDDCTFASMIEAHRVAFMAIETIGYNIEYHIQPVSTKEVKQ